MLKIDKDELSLKIKEKRTLKQLSEHFNCAPSTLKYWIKKFGLKLFRGAKGKYPKDYLLNRKCLCGETDPNKFYGNKVKVCAICHNKITLESGRKKRKFIIDHLGGKCFNCGFDLYQSALDVHHRDPSQKDPRFKSVRGWSKERILKELVNCILLCKNCHTAYHTGELINDKLSGVGV